MKPAWIVLACWISALSAEVIRPAYTCKDEDLQWAGMTCSEQEPCPIYLDLAHVYPIGRRIFATGNIHSSQTTLYSIVLESDDAGATWREPVERQRGGELDQIQFLSFEKGWISGQRVYPLPGDPFLLITSDGGKAWRRIAILPEGSDGFIQHFWFDSPSSGVLAIDRGGSDSEQMRYAKYESETGGSTWTIRESSDKPIIVGPKYQAIEDASWRVRGDAKTKLLLIEKETGAGWTPVASFSLELAQCRGEQPAAAPPAPPTASPESKSGKDYVEELRLGAAPKKSKGPK